jgi:hypothetical protein
MKRSIYILLSVAFLFAMTLLINPAQAQEPPHPPTSGHGSTGNQSPNGSAPVGGGIGILVAFGMAYASRKISIFGKKTEE